MKLFRIIMLFLVGALTIGNVAGQANASLAVLTQNSGNVNLGGTVNIQININNTGPTSSIGVNKVRCQLSVPAALVSIPAVQAGLPTGWIILSNNGSVITVCNGSDIIPVGEARVVLISVQGNALGGPSTVLGNLSFGPGTGVCTGPGTLPGDNTADNSSSSSITVLPAAVCALGVTATAGTIACNGGTTTLTATPAGQNGAVEYSITGGAPFQAANTFTVPAGSYTVTAREVATPSCTATSTAVVIGQPTPVVASGSVTTPIATIGGSGVITISATGGTAPYTGVGPFNRTAGTYSFTVTDANGCTATTSVTINDPAACIITGVTATAGTIACNGGTTTLTAVAAPAGTYQYSLNGGAFQASGTFTGVAAGAYTIVARETANTVCTATATGTITQPTAIAATAAVTTPIALPGGNGVITVSATGGTAPYTGTGAFTRAAGSYTFTVTDANGCTATTAAIVLANPGVASADPAVGQMFFTTTGGAVQNANNLLLAPAADLYDINVPFYNLNQLNAVPNGTISLRVNLGRKLVLAPGFNLGTAPLSAYFTWAQSSVNGDIILTGTQSATIPADFDGFAIFRVKGDSACRSNVVSTVLITNILQTLVDDDTQNNAASLQYNLPITLTNTQVNVTCFTAGNGIINVVASSGTSVLTTGPGGYTNTTGLASGVNNFTLSGLAPGTYTITASATSVGPLANCSVTTTVIITQPVVLTLPAASVTSTNINCFAALTGTITVVAAGGTAPYTYTIAGPTVNTTGANSGIFTGLGAGSYTVTVTDNNGCTATTAAIIITQPIGGIPDITLGSDVTGSLFATPGVTQTIVYNVAEIAGNSAVGDTIRITRVAGFTINFNPTLFSTTVGATTYALDNTRWKIDNSNPAFVSIILTDPLNAANPGTILCNQLVRVAVSITRNTPNISTFTLSARLRRANGEVNLGNNLNSIIFAAD